MSSPELTPAQRRAETLAKMFDLRMFIGSLFVVFGIIVSLDGLFASSAEIEKAEGINLSLWTGLIMLATGIFFVAWTLISPPKTGTPSWTFTEVMRAFEQEQAAFAFGGGWFIEDIRLNAPDLFDRVGPDGFRLGRRVVYRREDVDRWLAAQQQAQSPRS